MAKISLIGAGSVVFARRLLQDIVCVHELTDATVSLMDTDPERLALMSKFANKLAHDTGTNIKIATTPDRREALDGFHELQEIQAVVVPLPQHDHC